MFAAACVLTLVITRQSSMNRLMVICGVGIQREACDFCVRRELFGVWRKGFGVCRKICGTGGRVVVTGGRFVVCRANEVVVFLIGTAAASGIFSDMFVVA